MKKFFGILFSIALAVELSGCVTAQDAATSITTTTQSIEQKIKSVQGYAKQICSFVPTVGSIAAIFASGYGTDVAAVANAICSSVTSIPLADGPGDHKPRVNGVIVKGKFVK